jgi:hypothetical protein
VWQWASYVAVGKLCGSGQAVRPWASLARFDIRPGVGAGVPVAHLGWFQHFTQSLFGDSKPSNKLHPDLTSSTVHKAALACVPKSSATPTSGTYLIARPKRLSLFSCADFGKMPRRTKAQLARDKARKLVQYLFSEFKVPVTNLTGCGAYLLLDGPAYFDDNYLTHHPVKLLPFDVSDTAILNSAPSFFKPWPVSKLKDHPVDVKAMGGEGFELLEIDDPVDVNTMGGEVFESLDIDDLVPGPLVSARDVEKFIDGQYFHVPRANLGPGTFETLSRHSKWCLISCVTLSISITLAYQD